MKVLVVDDEPDVRKIISEALRRSGFETVAAGDADEAVAHFLAGGVDMITLDHRMPGISGAELHGLVSREFGEGVVGVLPKPFKLDQLVEIVKDTTGRHGSG